MEQASLFPETHAVVADDEVAAVLRQAIQGGGRLPRSADLLLGRLCADHLLAELRGAGFEFVRSPA